MRIYENRAVRRLEGTENCETSQEKSIYLLYLRILLQ